MKRITLAFYGFAAAFFAFAAYLRFEEGDRFWGIAFAVIGAWDLLRFGMGLGAGPPVPETPADPFGTPGPDSVVVEVLVTGRNRIAAIKALREAVPGLGLKDGKDIVDRAMEGRAALLTRAATPEQAERLREALAASGAGIEVA